MSSVGSFESSCVCTATHAPRRKSGAWFSTYCIAYAWQPRIGCAPVSASSSGPGRWPTASMPVRYGASSETSPRRRQ